MRGFVLFSVAFGWKFRFSLNISVNWYYEIVIKGKNIKNSSSVPVDLCVEIVSIQFQKDRFSKFWVKNITDFRGVFEKIDLKSNPNIQIKHQIKSKHPKSHFRRLALWLLSYICSKSTVAVYELRYFCSSCFLSSTPRVLTIAQAWRPVAWHALYLR